MAEAQNSDLNRSERLSVDSRLQSERRQEFAVVSPVFAACR